EVLEEVALPQVRGEGADAFLLEGGVARQLRRLAIAEIDEDQPEILLHRVGPDPDAAAEGLRLGRLLGALAGGVVLPAVVEAPDLFTLHPAGAELRAAMRAAEGDGVDLAALAPVEREVLA